MRDQRATHASGRPKPASGGGQDPVGADGLPPPIVIPPAITLYLLLGWVCLVALAFVLGLSLA